MYPEHPYFYNARPDNGSKSNNDKGDSENTVPIKSPPSPNSMSGTNLFQILLLESMPIK
jgi:hypothetical protein